MTGTQQGGPANELYPLAPRALATFGPERQLLALSEELSEASAKVSRLLNKKGDRSDLIEELVDVESVAASLRDWLATPEEWDAVRLRKREKLAAKLAKGEIRTREAAKHG